MHCLEVVVARNKETVPEFKSFPKIARLSRDIVISEKIDGTNAAIWISDDGTIVQAGSRTRWIYPDKSKDNFGFAFWVEQNRTLLALALGPGLHHGEWWGAGIQRGYGLDHKRLSLFNPKHYEGAKILREEVGVQVYTVPILYTGPFERIAIDHCLSELQLNGSIAAPGFMDPEGVVIYHTAANVLFKKTIKGDEKPKGGSE